MKSLWGSRECDELELQTVWSGLRAGNGSAGLELLGMVCKEHA